MIETLSKFTEPAYAATGSFVSASFLRLHPADQDEGRQPFCALRVSDSRTHIHPALPVVLLAGILLKVESQAIVGLLGTIIGYIFGTSKVTSKKGRRRQQQDEEDDDAA